MWHNSLLRTWLRKDFYKTAFTEKERKKIIDVKNENPLCYDMLKSAPESIDSIFVLNFREAEELQKNTEFKDMKCVPTDYAKSKGAWVDKNRKSLWWLRWSDGYSHFCWVVVSEGYVHRIRSIEPQITENQVVVRPTMWIHYLFTVTGTNVDHRCSLPVHE